MRAFISFFVALCLFLAACSALKDVKFELGERKDGDHKFMEKLIMKPEIPWKAMKVVLGAKAPDPIEIINYYLIESMNGKPMNFVLLKGGINTTNIAVMVMSGMGDGMLLKMQAFAINSTEGMITDGGAEPSITFE